MKLKGGIKMKQIFICIMVIIIVVLCLVGCVDSSSNGYSGAYYGDSGYRKTVDDISKMTGDSHYEVDRKIDAMTRAVNGE